MLARLQRQLSRKVKYSDCIPYRKYPHPRQACGYTANADVNGARNIVAAGQAVLACGGMVQSGRPLKQEPTEMIQATA